MITKAQVAKGLGVLAINAGVVLSDAQVEVYHAMLKDLEPDGWDAAVRSAVNRPGTSYGRLPTIGELREFSQPYVDTPAEAVRAYEAVKACKSYVTGYGFQWRFSRILEELGPMAAEAYVAAGAASAFEKLTDQSEPFVRKSFVESFVRTVQAVRAGRQVVTTAPKRERLPAAVQQLVGSVGRPLPPSEQADFMNAKKTAAIKAQSLLPQGHPVSSEDAKEQRNP